jgi:hypothetical protein
MQTVSMGLSFDGLRRVFAVSYRLLDGEDRSDCVGGLLVSSARNNIE